MTCSRPITAAATIATGTMMTIVITIATVTEIAIATEIMTTTEITTGTVTVIASGIGTAIATTIGIVPGAAGTADSHPTISAASTAITRAGLDMSAKMMATRFGVLKRACGM